jgi:hypothetical protein
VRVGRHPLARLLRGLEQRRVSYVRVQKGDDLVEWRRAS